MSDQSNATRKSVAPTSGGRGPTGSEVSSLPTGCPPLQPCGDLKTSQHRGPKKQSSPKQSARLVPMSPAFHDPKHHIEIYQGDCREILAVMPAESVDLIFADPPYFLSNGGITCHAGRMVSVNKGAWDRSQGAEANHAFNREWLAAAQRVLKPNGSIWVCGI